MLFELSIIPAQGDGHTSDEIADAIRLIRESGIPYQLNPGSTCIEGEWEPVMKLIHECQKKVRLKTNHLVLMIKVEDHAGEQNKLMKNVVSVAEKVPLGETADPLTSACEG